MLLISHMKLFKLKLKSSRYSFINNFCQQEKIKEPLIHAQKSGTEIIPSCLVISSGLKKSLYKGGTNIVLSRVFIPSRFLYKQLLRFCCSYLSDILTHFRPFFSFSPMKTKKTSGKVKREYCLKWVSLITT